MHQSKMPRSPGAEAGGEMTNHKHGDLRMFIRSEPFEVECDGCYGCFRGKYYGGEIDAKTIALNGGTPYNKCHGTGKRTVRLVGSVGDVAARSGGYMSGVIEYGTFEAGYYPSRGQLAEAIIDQHYAGKLHVDLYKSDTNPDGLREENDQPK